MWVPAQQPAAPAPPPPRPLFSAMQSHRQPSREPLMSLDNGVARPPASLRADQHAFFLDVDGTLIEYAQHPGAVTVDPELLQLLGQLRVHSGGAIALVSGRSIENLDTLLAPLELPASGLHGFERRSFEGVYTQHTRPSRQALALGRQLMAQLSRTDPRLVLEDKGCALALHFRQVPYLEEAVIEALKRIAERTQGELQLQLGPLSAELIPHGVTKATAIAEFMREPPFRGRRPLYLGDSATDETGFQWVNAAGGLSVAVNITGPTAARTHLRSVSAVRAWLQALAASPG
jgi:trehalose 6-phosphate phosphatase